MFSSRPMVMVLVLAAFAGESGSPRIAAQLSALQLLERYANGDFEAVVRSLADAAEPDRLRKDLEIQGVTWAGSGATEAERTKRRLVAATLAVEFAHARLDEDWILLRSLVEWGCELLRRGYPSDGERIWHQAALAVAGGALDDRLLFKPGAAGPKVYNHYSHSESRFPSDKRIVFAKFFAVPAPARIGSLSFYAGLEPPLDTADPRRAADFYGRASDRTEAAKRLMTLVTDSELAGEAAVRAGYLLLVNVNLDEALAAFKMANRVATTSYASYLSHFLSGRTLERMNRLEDASEAYSAALGVVPHAQSGVLARSALLVRAGRTAEAYALTEESFQRTPRPPDPWRLFAQGDYYRWSQVIRELRQVVRP